MERILNLIREERVGGMVYQIVETAYEYGRHYVLVINGRPGFHSVDYDRVEAHLNSILKYYR